MNNCKLRHGTLLFRTQSVAQFQLRVIHLWKLAGECCGMGGGGGGGGGRDELSSLEVDKSLRRIMAVYHS